MAIVLWGGTYPVQPVRGEMRRFIIRSRVDGTSTAVAQTDTNKVIPLRANWILAGVWTNVIKASTNVRFGTGVITDQVQTYGASFYLGTADCATGASLGVTAPWVGLMNGNIIATAGYLGLSLAASFSTTGFNGIIDVYADIIDANAYESPHTPSFAD
jgi:hypothetical protein